jgi:hypothetical protein
MALPYKYKYTTGGEFVLTGSDYVGYYNVLDNNAYQGRFNQEISLRPTEVIDNEINLSETFFDRSVLDVFSFKYDIGDVKFQPNEIINKNSINTKLENLYDNFIDIYRYSQIITPLAPVGFVAQLGVSGLNGDLVWTDNNYLEPAIDGSSSQFALSSFDPAFSDDALDTIKIETLQNRNNDFLTFILSVSSSIFFIVTDKSYATLQAETGSDFDSITAFPPVSGVGNFDANKFSSIKSITTNRKDILYVSDEINNQLYSIYIGNITSQDRTGDRSVSLIDTIGNTGIDDTNFEQISFIEYGNSSVFVFDSGEKSIKKFTSELLYRSKYLNTTFFTTNTVLAISYNINNNYLYVATDQNIIVVLDTDTMDEVERYKFQNNLFLGEPIVDILFSENNSNIYYIQTDSGLYKFFLNRKNILIARFKIGGNFALETVWGTTETDWRDTLPTWGEADSAVAGQFKASALLNTGDDFDRISFMFNNRILQFHETDDQFSLLNEKSLPFYTKNEVLIQDDMFNNITLNKTMGKMLHNMNLITQNISKKVNVSYGRYVIPEFFALLYIDKAGDKQIVTESFMKNLFVGMNETTSTKVFNRMFESMLNYQKQVIALLDVGYNNENIPKARKISF